MKKFFALIFIFSLLLSACQQPPENNASIKGLEKADKDPQKKVILVMIDSMTGSVIDKTKEKGSIPGLQFLMENGQYYKDLVAPFPSMSVVIESTLLTGKMADEHRIPGLNWYKVDEDRYIDYGTSIEKTLKLTPKQSFEDSLYHLNNTHLNPNIPTIHEELHAKGFTTGSVNFIMYRGHKSHPVYIPPYIQETLDLPESMQTNGPDLLAFGQLVKPQALKDKKLPESIFRKLGLNDEYSVEATKALIEAGEQPDFLTIFLPDFDREAHEHSIQYLKGFERAETFFQELLNSYDSWEQALEENIFIVMGDHGQDKLLDNDVELTIDLEELYEGMSIAPLGEKVSDYEIAFANNHRMSYVYAPNNQNSLSELAEIAMIDDRIAIASWVDGEWIHVLSPNYNSSFRFRPGNTYRDRYDQGWDIEGDERIAAIKIEKNQLKYEEYPDVLNQLQSALYSHDIPTLILAAKPSYQFYSEGAPVHEGGGEHGGIHANDTLASLIIAGTEKNPEKLRIVDLKAYILGLFEANE
ncbi:nucleotide pyrophosphatase [Anaerobacillus alkaliphilus]|uniref:Nucleotide pyrophosphatase n=1 Tax=Anaerobacillus alkaliphilus TaxID=1548597 RepID=A0A4Q0VVZ3_9BACI|nr:alkaline phosphatase family protein [Anaerobacillus alkaliphilus]RXJ03863.1 nucleotide pyrophosphatase [Anaerobacillus alkaliphilus]